MENTSSSATAFSRRQSLALIGALPVVAGLGTAQVSSAQDVDISGDGVFNPKATFVPISPILAKKTFVWRGSTETEVPWASLDEASRRQQLSNQDAKVVIEKIENSGSIGYLDSGISGGKGSYRVTVDYLRYKDEIVTSQGSTIGRGKVGVGVRVTANIRTKKSGLNLSGLLPIAVNLSRQYVSGDLEVRAIGIVTPEIAKIITTPTSLTEESISKAMEAFGAFRVVIDQKDTVTVPHLMAVAQTGQIYGLEKTVQEIGSAIS